MKLDEIKPFLDFTRDIGFTPTDGIVALRKLGFTQEELWNALKPAIEEMAKQLGMRGIDPNNLPSHMEEQLQRREKEWRDEYHERTGK